MGGFKFSTIQNLLVIFQLLKYFSTVEWFFNVHSFFVYGLNV